MSKIRTAVMLGVAALSIAAGAACGAGAPSDPGTFAPHTPATTAAHTTRPTTPAPTVRPTTAEPTPAPTTKAVSAEQQNATEKAQDYLDGATGFSRKSLIEQLNFEGYPAKVSTAAVDSLRVDWYKQAEVKAKDYLSGQSFSRSGLISQLEYEGFSAAQARHGVKAAGL
jgi:hypothetical protein